MNKYQDAFNNLKSLCSSSYYYKKDIALLRELVDKETPKKPIKFKYKLLYGWACPHCAKDIANNRKQKRKNIKYCPYCGQKLDWGEEE